MGQLIFNLVITSLVVCNLVMTYGLVKSALDTDESVSFLHDRFSDILGIQGRINEQYWDRIEGIENWIVKSIRWMNRQQAKTRRNTKDIEKLKDSGTEEPEEELRLPDLEEIMLDPAFEDRGEPDPEAKDEPY